jgi:hypothetical protein
MNTFCEHHKNSIKFAYRCFDRILLNGLIQPFQQPERVIGFFDAYRQGQRVTRNLLRDIAQQFQNWVPLMAWNSRPCDRSMWLPGLRTFRGPNRPLSKSSLRFGCCTIFWSFGKSYHRIRHIPFAVQSTSSKKAKRQSGAAKMPRRY